MAIVMKTPWREWLRWWGPPQGDDSEDAGAGDDSKGGADAGVGEMRVGSETMAVKTGGQAAGLK